RLVCARLALWLLGQDRFDIALSGRELRLPRHAIDGLQRFDFTIGSHTELRELASTREDLSLERSDCAVEGVDGVAEAASEPAQVSREDGQSTIEILAERSDRLGVLSERELAPTVRDRLQQGDEARRRCDDDVLANRVLEKSGVLGESRGQELIARYEKDHEVRALLELAPVGLGTELTNSLCYRLCMTAQRSRTFLIRRGIHRIEIRIESGFHVDHEIAAIGHVHDHVGPQAPFLGTHVNLLDEVAVLDHACKLGETAQRHLAPLAAYLGATQGIYERTRLLLQRLLTERNRLERALQAAERLRSLFLDPQHLLFGLEQCLFDGAEHRLDRLLARRQRSRSGLLMLGQVFARKVQEQLAIRAERRTRDGVERSAQLLHCAIQSGGALAFELLVRLHLRLEDGELDVQCFGTFALAPSADQRAEHDTEHERNRGDEERGDERRHRS